MDEFIINPLVLTEEQKEKIKKIFNDHPLDGTLMQEALQSNIAIRYTLLRLFGEEFFINIV